MCGCCIVVLLYCCIVVWLYCRIVVLLYCIVVVVVVVVVVVIAVIYTSTCRIHRPRKGRSKKGDPANKATLNVPFEPLFSHLNASRATRVHTSASMVSANTVSVALNSGLQRGIRKVCDYNNKYRSEIKTCDDKYK